jgi:gliding motility-associated-like protein
MKTTLLLLFLLISWQLVRATHFIGGNLEMRALDAAPGRYEIIFKAILEANQPATTLTAELDVFLYRKRDGKLLDRFQLARTRRDPLIFSNQACGEATSTRPEQVLFARTVTLNPAEFADPEGYFLLTNDCCRNGGITNLSGLTAGLSTSYTLEFPALRRGTQPVLNSSPSFRLVNGEVICRGELFRMNFGADDADGDQLRYSLTDPLAGGASGDGVRIESLGRVPWGAGYSAQTAIRGTPPLRIDPVAGILTVRASQLGLFVFAVLVEEFRDGRRIGAIRRDYQLRVVDCPPTPLDEPRVAVLGVPRADSVLYLCEGQPLTLQVGALPGVNYQWARDGYNLPGANRNDVTVTETGTYQVFATQASLCGQARASAQINVRVLNTRTRLGTPDGTLLCGGRAVRLAAPPGADYDYAWFRNNQPLGVTTATLQTQTPGRYTVRIRDLRRGCASRADTVDLRPAVAPVVRLTSTRAVICGADSVRLTASTAAPGVTWEWYRNDSLLTGATRPSLTVRRAGAYLAVAQDTTVCAGYSDTLRLAARPIQTPRLDSLPPVCGTEGPVLRLTGTPAGGVFSGQGVANDQFSPRLAGLGEHLLSYRFDDPATCTQGTATRRMVVSPVQVPRLPAELRVWRGTSAELPGQIADPGAQYLWTPSVNLSSVTVPNPIVTPTGEQTYSLRVVNRHGCAAEARIRVYVEQRIWVADAFSPNGDGQNEVWELKGIEAYPEAEVRIYNRWGIAVFQSVGYQQPFNGGDLPAGTYAYTLRYAPDEPVLRGTVQLIR